MNSAQSNEKGRGLPARYVKDKEPKVIRMTDARPTRTVANVQQEAKELQEISTASNARTVRRLLFVWLRIFSYETKWGKAQKVNVGIPIPIPLVGALFGRKISWEQATHLAADPEVANDPEFYDAYLSSCMSLEFVRFQEYHPERGKKQLVVIGFD